MNRLCFVLITVFLSLFACHSATALVLQVDDGFQTRALGPGIEYFREEGHRNSIEEIIEQRDWKKVTAGQPGFGFDSRAHWLKFDLLNAEDQRQDLLVALPNSYLDSIDLYVTGPSGDVRSHQKSGDRQDPSSKPIAHAENIHPLSLSAGENLTVYIRVKSSSSLSIPVQVWSQDTYLAFDYKRTVALGIFLGLMIMFSLYHLVIAALTRDSSALFYTLLVFSIFVVFAYRKGVPASLFSSAYMPSTETANVIVMGLTVFSLCFFTSRILRIPRTIPKLAKLLHLAGLAALLPILMFLVVDYSVVIRLSLGYSLLVIGIYAWSVIRRALDGYPPARPMIIASVFGVTGNGLGILSSINLVPITFSIEAIIYTCNALMALFFALTLSYRISVDRALMEEAQRQHTHELDELVRQRTEELENVNEKLRLVSITDGLTGLYNRRHFDEMLATAYNRAFRENHSLAILLLDVDHFKNLNDTHGHSFGDLCLTKTGEIIKQSLRRPLDVAARYGGEEFVILLPDTELSGARHIAETLRKTIETTVIKSNEAETSMTISVGVAAEVPSQADQQEALLHRADELLYQAKRNGRNRVEG